MYNHQWFSRRGGAVTLPYNLILWQSWRRQSHRQNCRDFSRAIRRKCANFAKLAMQIDEQSPTSLHEKPISEFDLSHTAAIFQVTQLLLLL